MYIYPAIQDIVIINSMAITAEQIKDLREKTGAGISDIKKALEESNGDMVKALALIERKMGGSAAKKTGRETKAGLVEGYIHSNARIGVLLELLCETDFVARNPEFKELAHNLAMHVAAMNPRYLSVDAIPEEIQAEERRRAAEEAGKMGKSAEVTEQIIIGKMKSYLGSLSLLDQPFVKDPNKTVGTYLNEAVGKFGENIKVGRFSRLEI